MAIAIVKVQAVNLLIDGLLAPAAVRVVMLGLPP
jgi:hypothetical protein